MTEPLTDTLKISLERLQAAGPIRTAEERNAREAERQRDMNECKAAELRLNWNAPKRQLNTTVAMDGEWGKTLSAFAPKLGTGFLVVLHGVHGGGKTQLGVELMRYQIEKRMKSARFTTAMEFFMAVKATYKDEADKDETKLIEEYRKPSLLVIDEVEKRGESLWENNLLFHLLNRRYNDVKDTVLISNLTSSELSTHLGPSLVSRLNETGGMIACNWPSRR